MHKHPHDPQKGVGLCLLSFLPFVGQRDGTLGRGQGEPGSPHSPGERRHRPYRVVVSPLLDVYEMYVGPTCSRAGGRREQLRTIPTSTAAASRTTQGPRAAAEETFPSSARAQCLPSQEAHPMPQRLPPPQCQSSPCRYPPREKLADKKLKADWEWVSDAYKHTFSGTEKAFKENVTKTRSTVQSAVLSASDMRSNAQVSISMLTEPSPKSVTLKNRFLEFRRDYKQFLVAGVAFASIIPAISRLPFAAALAPKLDAARMALRWVLCLVAEAPPSCSTLRRCLRWRPPSPES